MKTGFQAARLAIAGFLIPFVFVYHPAVLYKLQILFVWFGGELPNSRAMIDLATVSWLDFFWIIAAFGLSVWLIASAVTGFERNRLHLIERVARIAVGLVVLLPNMALALPAFAAGAGLIVLHRFLGGEPSPIDQNTHALRTE